MKKYYINKFTGVPEATYEDSVNEAYRQYYFETMKEVKYYKENIYDTEYGKLGMVVGSHLLQEEIQINNRLEKISQDINIKEEILKEEPKYANGFRNTKEWEDRLIIDYYYKYYSNIWNARVIETKELILERMIPRRSPYSRITAAHIDKALFQNRFYKTLQHKDILNAKLQFWDEYPGIKQKIEEQEEAYHKLNEETKLEDENLNDLKDFLINRLVLYNRLKRRKREINVFNLASSPDQEDIGIVNLKNLSLEYIRHSFSEGYNLFVYRPWKKDRCLQIENVTYINGRLALIDRDNMIALNDDVIYIDTRMNGNIPELENKSFYNPNQPDYSRKSYIKKEKT